MSLLFNLLLINCVCSSILFKEILSLFVDSRRRTSMKPVIKLVPVLPAIGNTVLITFDNYLNIFYLNQKLQADFYQKILGDAKCSGRFGPTYFLVRFFGLGFSSFLRVRMSRLCYFWTKAFPECRQIHFLASK